MAALLNKLPIIGKLRKKSSKEHDNRDPKSEEMLTLLKNRYSTCDPKITRMRANALSKILDQNANNPFIRAIRVHQSSMEDKFFAIDQTTLFLVLKAKEKNELEIVQNFLNAIIKMGSNLLLPPKRRNAKWLIYKHDKQSDSALHMWNEYRKYLTIMGYHKVVTGVLLFNGSQVQKVLVTEVVLDMMILKEQLQEHLKQNEHTPFSRLGPKHDANARHQTVHEKQAKYKREHHHYLVPRMISEDLPSPVPCDPPPPLPCVAAKRVLTDAENEAQEQGGGIYVDISEIQGSFESQGKQSADDSSSNVQPTLYPKRSGFPIHPENAVMDAIHHCTYTQGADAPDQSQITRRLVRKPPLPPRTILPLGFNAAQEPSDGMPLYDPVFEESNSRPQSPNSDQGDAIYDQSLIDTPTETSTTDWDPVALSKTWNCIYCTFENGIESNTCLICRKARDMTTGIKTFTRNNPFLDQIDLDDFIEDDDSDDYTEEELKFASLQCGDENPTQWLRNNYDDTLEMIVKLASASCDQENLSYTLTNTEVRDVIRKSDGALFAAIQECSRICKEKNQELLGVCPSSSEIDNADLMQKLLGLGFEWEHILEAVECCSEFETARVYLEHHCPICASKYPVSKMVTMLSCSHEICRDCTDRYFTSQILNMSIKNAICPCCAEPQHLDDEDVFLDYFSQLDIMLRGIVSPDVHEVFQKKMRDEVLRSLANFHWCTKCESGYVADDLNLEREECPYCKMVTCATCKKEWRHEHEGKTCEDFAELQTIDADSQSSISAIEREFEVNGIRCPKCESTYSLARGGCMHFVCPQCKHEFCSGCDGQFFRTSKECGYADHGNLGLHAHHPKNCLFYLRDQDPEFLQKLLTDYGIEYETENVNGNEVCAVLEQKERECGFVDAACGRRVEEAHAGLCRVHYIEYLSKLIAREDVKPTYVFKVDHLEIVEHRQKIGGEI